MSTMLLILDLDGTLRRCRDPRQPTPDRPGEQVLIPEAVGAALRHIEAGARVALATNQGGIALGYLTEVDHVQVRDELMGMLAATGFPPDTLYLHCPHGPGSGCPRRKPAPGMLLEAMAHFSAAPSETLFVGDRRTDLAAAREAGVRFEWADDFAGLTREEPEEDWDF